VNKRVNITTNTVQITIIQKIEEEPKIFIHLIYVTL